MKKMTAFVLTAMAIMVFAFCMPAQAEEDTAVSKILPELSLRVVSEEAENGNISVTYIAKLSNHRLLLKNSGSIRPMVIDFYTGNTELTLYPNEYIGKALVNINGVAELMVIQKPGEYVGGAILSGTYSDEIYSNGVIYKVPEIPPVKPLLKLEVFAGAPSVSYNSDATLPKENVTYKATLVNSRYSASASADEDISIPITKRTVSFYMASSDSELPDELIGSAEIDSTGVAKISFY